MRQMLDEMRILNHRVLGIAEHIGLAIGGYCSEFDSLDEQTNKTIYSAAGLR
jgi:hypothetical protein